MTNEYTLFRFQEKSIYFIQDSFKTEHLAATKGGILIAESLLNSKKEIILSRLKNALGLNKTLPARACTVKPINKREAFEFLEKHHLFGGTKSERQFGLYLPAAYFRLLPHDFEKPSTDLLLAVITFANPRTFEGNISSHELIRYGVYPGFNVAGGLSKLISIYARLYKPDEIMTYVDGDWSAGEGFKKVGFETIIEPQPYIYTFDQQGKRILSTEEKGFVSRGNLKMKRFFTNE